jgi:class 3 adenylate cyclase
MRLGQEVEGYGGTVDKYIGDNVMAIFGAPVAHEDDAERAVRAGLGMQAAMGEVNEGLPTGVHFDLRVGVNTGEVLAGAVGESYTVTGDPVNVAARTESATRITGDDVLITAETARLLRSDFGLAERPGVTMKGIDEPMTLYAPAVPDRVPESGDGHAESLGAFPAVRALGGPPGRSTAIPDD